MGTMGSDVTRGYRNQSPGKQIHQLFCFLKWQILFFFSTHYSLYCVFQNNINLKQELFSSNTQWWTSLEQREYNTL